MDQKYQNNRKSLNKVLDEPNEKTFRVNINLDINKCGVLIICLCFVRNVSSIVCSKVNFPQSASVHLIVRISVPLRSKVKERNFI